MSSQDSAPFNFTGTDDFDGDSRLYQSQFGGEGGLCACRGRTDLWAADICYSVSVSEKQTLVRDSQVPELCPKHSLIYRP